MKIRETEKLKVQKQKRLKLNTRPCFKIPSSEFSNLGLAARHGLWPSLSLSLMAPSSFSKESCALQLCRAPQFSLALVPRSSSRSLFYVPQDSWIFSHSSASPFPSPRDPMKEGEVCRLFFHWEEFHSPPLPKKADMASKYFPLLFYL